MKRFVLIIAILLSSFVLSAQNKINTYQYWFDDDFSNATTTVLSSEQTLNLQTDIDVSHLTPGVHIFYIRFKDDNNLWSSPTAQYIYRFVEQNLSSVNNEIVEYQYWFDNDFSNAVNQSVTASQNYQMLMNIDLTALNSGVHIFYIRYKDNRGQWSSPVAQFIYKLPEQTSILSNEITSYQYWFDDDFSNAVNQPATASQNYQMLMNIDLTALNSGVHIFYIRYKDNRGQWSSPVAQFFYKLPEQTSILSNEITSYQYWFDDDFSNAVNQSATASQNYQMLTDIDASELNSGVHIFYIRFLDDRGQWSSPVSQFIYKFPETQSADNKIITYRYWFDDDFNNVHESVIIPAQNFFSLQDEVDMTQIWKGEYIIHYQFKDSLGLWSSPTIDTIEKISLPIAEFTYSRLENCDSTVIDFQNLSMDGDTHFWSFGDGAVSTDSATSHIYYETGNYLVSLTVTDTVSLADSTITELIHIIGPTNHSITEVVCDAFTAPSGAIFTESGIHYDTITNYMFCDSIIEINLTVLESSFVELNVHACDSFVSPSGQVYYASGQYFDTIPNFAGCDSIIEITLDLGTTTYATINEDVCDFYLSPAENTYTESGIYYDTIPNTALCDSIIEINLNIRESSYSYLSEEVCDIYNSPSGNIYTESGIYYDTIPNTALCDSVIEINLTILESSFAELNVHACDSFVTASGQVYYASGQYFDTIPNFVGCDSIMTINLDITTIDNSVTINDRSLFANQDNAVYQWLDCDAEMSEIQGANEQEFFPDIDGNYAVQIVLNNCEEISSCYGVFGLSVAKELVDGLKVYPNPTTGLVKIELPNIKKDIQLSVYDMTGKLIQELSDKNTAYLQFTIYAPKAVYFVRIFADDETYSRIIVVE